MRRAAAGVRIKAMLAAGMALQSVAADDLPAGLHDTCPGFVKSLERMRVPAPLLPAIPAPPPTDPALRDDLLARVRDDQMARAAWQPSLSADQNEALARHLSRVDGNNLVQLRVITALYGFPDEGQVGADGVAAAWLLVQHADGDPALQARVLEHISAGESQGGLTDESIAMLTDRVLLAQGKPQRYGSQLQFDRGGWTLRPTEDEAHVDDRRRSMGMPSLADYQCAMRTFYGEAPARDDR